MVSRAIQVHYQTGSDVGQDNFDANGNPILYAIALFVDTADSTKSRLMGATIVLDATSPAGWSATIKAALVQLGVDNGFTDLVSTSVYIPTYA